MIWRQLIFVSLGLAFASPATADGEAQGQRPRLALVIGNADYNDDGQISPDVIPIDGNQTDLRAAVNDARDVAAALQRAAYDVTLRENLRLDQLQEALSDFSSKVAASDERAMVVVYYAGHGVSVANRNFLVPIGARLPTNVDLSQIPAAAAQLRMQGLAVAADELLYIVGNRPQGTTVVIIDACRNNPWDRRVRGAFRGDIQSGLARMEAAGSSIVGFSAEPGRVAQDVGKGRNSPFAEALLPLISRKDLSFLDLWSLVAQNVSEATKMAQHPWISGVPLGRFCLAGCAPTSLQHTAPVMVPAVPVIVEQATAAVNFRLIRTTLWPLTVSPGERAIIRVPTHSSDVRVFAIFRANGVQSLRVDGAFSQKYGGNYIPFTLPASFRGKEVEATVVVQRLKGREEEVVSRVLNVQS